MSHQSELLKPYEDLLLAWRADTLTAAEAEQQFLALPHANPVEQGLQALYLGLLANDQNQFSPATDALNRARAIFERARESAWVAWVDFYHGEIYRRRGDYAHARQQFGVAHASANALHAHDLAIQARVREALMMIHSDSFEQVQLILDRAFQSTHSRWEGDLTHMARVVCDIHRGLALVHLHDNKLNDAWARAQQAFRTAQNAGDHLTLGYAHRVVGEVLTRLPQPAFVPEGCSTDPDFHFKQALSHFRQSKAEHEMGHTLYKYAVNLHARGQKVSAARQLQHAMQFYGNLGMIHDVAKATELQTQVI